MYMAETPEGMQAQQQCKVQDMCLAAMADPGSKAKVSWWNSSTWLCWGLCSPPLTRSLQFLTANSRGLEKEAEQGISPPA